MELNYVFDLKFHWLPDTVFSSSKGRLHDQVAKHSEFTQPDGVKKKLNAAVS